MRGNTLEKRVTSQGEPLVRRTSNLLLGSAIASMAICLALPAHAQECGAPVNGAVTCAPSGNPFPVGIEYFSPAVNPAQDPGLDPTAPVYDLTVVLQPGVRVTPLSSLPGVAVIGFNDGAVTLEAGVDTAIQVSGTGALGVLGLTNYGDLTINTDSIVATGRASGGINANSNEGDISVSANTIAVTGNSGLGISANSYLGDVSINVGSVASTGYYVGGINAYTGQGDISITAGSVSTTGGSFYNYGSTAIEARSIGGSIGMDLGSVSTEADYSNGVTAVSFAPDGVVDISADSITTSGFASLGVLMQGDTANLSVGDLTTTGDSAYGAVMFSTGLGGANFTSTGTVSTSGDNATGVFAKSYYGGDTVINAANVTTQGNSSTGVYGYSQAADTTITVGNVSTVGNNSPAVLAAGYNASVTVNGNVSTQGNNSEGVIAVGFLGDANVVNNGAITTSGNGSNGIYAAAFYDVAVSGAGSVKTSGDGSTGIAATSLYGGIDISAGSVTTTGDYAQGISAYAGSVYGDSDVTVNVGSVTTSGTFSDGIGAFSLTGNIDITSTGAISTAGDGAFGAYAFSLLGDTSITVNDLTTTGDDAIGVQATGFDAHVIVNGDLSTSGTVDDYGFGADGVQATGLFGIATVDINGSVTTAGDGATAVAASGAYGATVANNGAITTGGDFANGITAESNFGSVQVINNGTVATSGTGSVGIAAAAYYDVSVSGTGSVRTSGDGATGIDASSLYGGIDITAATVTTTGDFAQGIRAYASSVYGGSDVTVNVGSVTTSGTLSDGIAALSLTGDVDVTSTGTISTAGDGAFGAYAFSLLGDASITVNNVKTTGDDAVGVQAYGYNASVTVNGALSTSGTDGAYGFGADGVQATGSFGTADVVINGSVTTSGDYATGVFARGYYGATVTNAGAITTSGDFANGVTAQSYYDVTVTNSGTITTSGDFSTGVNVQAGYGPGIVVNNGTISTSGESSAGILVDGYSDVAVQGTGSVRTTGDYSAGIGVSAFSGRADVAAASVTTTGNVATAINAYGSQGAVVNVGTVSTQGDSSLGILAGSYANVRVLANSVSTTGDNSDAIRAATFGDGSTIGISVGSVSTTGVNSNAITALGFGGDVGINLKGAISAAKDTAVTIQSAGNVVVAVGVAGSVTGAINGIESDAVGTTTITNLGTINTGSGRAIVVSGGPAVITNAGTLNGRVLLSAGNDTFTNTGLFRATASSDFGAGTDVFTNSGTLLVDAPGTAPLNVTFTGLETFNNAGGLVDLRNGTVGDQLTLPGTFTGAGASRLGLDLTSDAAGVMTADRLNVGTAAGSTQIQLSLGGTVYVTPGLTLVQASAPSSPTAFTLAPNLADVGLVALDLVYRPTSFAYQLVGTPGAGAYRAGKLLEGAQSLWYRSADAVTAHLASVRDGRFSNGANSGGFWLEMAGGVDKRDESRAVSQFGIARTYDLDYRQDYFGGQLGIDIGTMGENGGAVFGVTGGYLNSTLRFYDATRFNYDAVNVGAYASLRAGGFFANGLVKYDHYWIDVNGGSNGYKDKLSGDSIGAQAEAGFRFGSDKFFAEPLASIAYVRTKLDDLQALGQVLDYDRGEGLRGKAGLRIGGTTALGGGNVMTFYASGMAVKEFKGKDGATFVSGPYALDLGNRRIGTYGQGTLGVNVTTPSGIVGFIEGTLDASKKYSGAGGRAGIKIPF